MSCKEKILLLGGGGHCKSVIDVIEQEGKYEIVGIIDKKEKLGQKILGYEIITTDDDLPLLIKSYKNILITIGQIGTGEKRKRLFEMCKTLGFSFPIIISPYAYVSKHSSIGEGTVILHGAVVNASVKVGKNCIINTKAIIEHDVVIQDHCHISTGAVINGGVIVKEGSFIGSNSTTKQYITIPENSFIKAGSLVK
ncbi:MAG: acetyltransferase [Hydrogenothermus sp.]|nr:MAG: acetyltransferase [Hydrogenothermus sp.]